jgi:hypothetical protein
MGNFQTIIKIIIFLGIFILIGIDLVIEKKDNDRL